MQARLSGHGGQLWAQSFLSFPLYPEIRHSTVSPSRSQLSLMDRPFENIVLIYPKAQNGPKALHNKVFRPKGLNI